ncbi:MAG TPA: hypothetical protein VHY37_03500 [Tepidisphaeraceae bacterium]|jgi:hypothetical protein|nr:hypothetical protein [Tepidisphaeraceae bacterium]
MQSFLDKNNRKWDVEINAYTAKKVREATGVYLGRMDQNTLSELSDPTKLSDVLYAACQKQAEKANVTADDFAEALDGNAAENATKALYAAIVDFFPTAQRDKLKAMLDKAIEIRDALGDGALKVIQELDVAEIVRKAFAEDAPAAAAQPESQPQ